MSKIAITFLALLHCVCLCGADEYTPRPQDPSEPYPYDVEEVVFHNRLENVTLAGTLTLPRTQGPFPVVILLHGSAPFDRDCTRSGHKLFLVWADHLTKQGIAVLRFDKRSAGKSTGNYATSTLENFAQDALAGIEYLKSRPDINPRQIGLVGHSEGGMTAFLAATQSDDVAFIVSMAAPCVNGEEIVYNQEPLLQRVDGVPEDLIAQTRQLRCHMFAVLKSEDDRESAEKKMHTILTHYFEALDPAQRAFAEGIYGNVEQQIQLFNSAWFRYWFVYDPTLTLMQVRVPILALNGALDWIVTPDQNLKLLAQTLEAVGHKDYVVVEIPQLNHAFQTCRTGSVKESETIEETTSPVALNIMSEWVLHKTGNHKS